MTGYKYTQTPDVGETGKDRTPSVATTPTAGKSRFLSPLGSGLKKNLFGVGEPPKEDETEDDPFMFVSGAFPGIVASRNLSRNNSPMAGHRKGTEQSNALTD